MWHRGIEPVAGLVLALVMTTWAGGRNVSGPTDPGEMPNAGIRHEALRAGPIGRRYARALNGRFDRAFRRDETTSRSTCPPTLDDEFLIDTTLSPGWGHASRY